ncbi:MAG: hypothetical protein MUF75_04780 [Bacteroidia bacterium]|jgi:hypothetical protein|nr:hypothetical protein [Bacteroidia bacterium]
MKDHRIVINNNSLDNTCENRFFKTDISIGYEHYPGQVHKGSVTKHPLYEYDGQALFLEHVIDIRNGNKCFWFMWYHENGMPKLPGSGVIDKDDIVTVINSISKIDFE